MRIAISYNGHATIVGHVEPFVRIGCPRISCFDVGAEVTVSRARPGSEAEGTIDVHPCVVLVGQGNEFLVRIERARVQIAGL